MNIGGNDMDTQPSDSLREAAGIQLDTNARIAYVGDGPLRLTRR